MRTRSLPAYVLVILVAAAGCSPSDPVLEPQLAKNWIVLDQPQSNLKTAFAYDLSAGVDSGCYATTSTTKSSSEAADTLKWTKAHEAGVTAALLKRLGFGGSTAGVDSGLVVLDSVYIEHAVNLAPLPSCVAAYGPDMLPVRPGIAATIGAKSLVFHLWEGSSDSVTATAEGTLRKDSVGAKAHFNRLSSGARTVSFDTPEVIGLQLVGFEGTKTREETTPITAIGTPVSVANRTWDVTVACDSNKHNGAFSVVVESSSPGMKPDSQLVLDRHQFFIGDPGSEARAGAFLVGHLYVGPRCNDYRVVTDRKGTRIRTFVKESDRQSLQKWVNVRQGNGGAAP